MTCRARCGSTAVLGFEMLYGGEEASFTSFRAGPGFLNLIAQPAERRWSWWGRVIFYDPDVDALHARLVAAGYRPDTAPRDAAWGERFFHITDPDGHELSFAWPLRDRPDRRDRQPAHHQGVSRNRHEQNSLGQDAHDLGPAAAAGVDRA